MKSFEEFIESRKQMDPSTSKLSDHQWGQAYKAYVSSRERLRDGSSAGGADKSSQSARRKSRRKGSSGMHQPSASSESTELKRKVRSESAYSDLRLIVDVLAWVAIAVIAMTALLSVMVAFDVYTALTALVLTGLYIIFVFVGKFLIQVIIDIPDIALYRIAEENKAQYVDPRAESKK